MFVQQCLWTFASQSLLSFGARGTIGHVNGDWRKKGGGKAKVVQNIPASLLPSRDGGNGVRNPPLEWPHTADF